MSDQAFYARTFALLTLALLAYLLYQILLPFLAPIAWALFIAFLLHPTHAWLERRLRGRPSWSAGLLTLATFLMLVGPLAALGKMAFVGALGTVVGFVLMMFILFFAIRDGRSLFASLRALIPMSESERARLFDHLASVTRAMVYGTGVTALVQGALIAVGFAFAGLPSPIVFGVLAALLALVPMAGTPVVWVPATIALALQGRYYAAIFLLVWGGAVTMVDNVLRPMLVSGRAQVGTLTVFIGVLGGVSAFGPIGIFLGPLVLALVVALVRFVLELREAQAGPR